MKKKSLAFQDIVLQWDYTRKIKKEVTGLEKTYKGILLQIEYFLMAYKIKLILPMYRYRLQVFIIFAALL